MAEYKPFDLEAAKRGEPVVTKLGKKARIVCFDVSGEKRPILALILNEREDGSTYESLIRCTTSGHTLDYPCLQDLFMAEPEIPDGFIRHDGGPCPVEHEAVERVVFDDGHVFFYGGKLEWEFHSCETKDWKKIIAYRLKPTVKEPDLQKLTERLSDWFVQNRTVGFHAGDVAKLLTQFAQAIIAECKK